jgi:hypothetical protein
MTCRVTVNGTVDSGFVDVRTLRDVRRPFDLSHQRVHQLLKG